MARIHPDLAINTAQAAHRKRLVETWKIAPGSRVLELGCGQGDTTAALIEAVGPNGHILAVDIGDRDYGTPLSLGQATDLLRVPQVEFRFGFNVDDPSVWFPPGTFDCVVMAHSSWYFTSTDSVVGVLEKVRPWAKRLCYSEWALTPESFDQVPHMLAVLIQGQVEAFKHRSQANVRTPFGPSTLKALLALAGWKVEDETVVNTAGLQDASWEIAASLASVAEARVLCLPPKYVGLLEEQVAVLKQLSGSTSLPCYSIVAVGDD